MRSARPRTTVDEPPPNYPDCVRSSEPCWAARCRHNLLRDEGPTGKPKETPISYDIDEVKTCALREADDGEHSFAEIAKKIHRSEESVRQDYNRGLRKLKPLAAKLEGRLISAADLVRVLLARKH